MSGFTWNLIGLSLANTINKINLLVSQNMANLENLFENESVDAHDNEEDNKASSMATNQQSQSQWWGHG